MECGGTSNRNISSLNTIIITRPRQCVQGRPLLVIIAPVHPRQSMSVAQTRPSSKSDGIRIVDTVSMVRSCERFWIWRGFGLDFSPSRIMILYRKGHLPRSRGRGQRSMKAFPSGSLSSHRRRYASSRESPTISWKSSGFYRLWSIQTYVQSSFSHEPHENPLFLPDHSHLGQLSRWRTTPTKHIHAIPSHITLLPALVTFFLSAPLPTAPCARWRRMQTLRGSIQYHCQEHYAPDPFCARLPAWWAKEDWAQGY